MKASKLFQNLSLGPYVLQNRIVLPPLTRSRSTQPGNIPNELMATYYQQRAGAGFMVTEGTQIEPRGQGYAWTPGIYSPEQIAGWCKVTEAVHAKGGIIFAQLWHVGRVSHTSLQLFLLSLVCCDHLLCQLLLDHVLNHLAEQYW